MIIVGNILPRRLHHGRRRLGQRSPTTFRRSQKEGEEFDYYSVPKYSNRFCACVLRVMFEISRT